jgi:hypothetical protein
MSVPSQDTDRSRALVGEDQPSPGAAKRAWIRKWIADNPDVIAAYNRRIDEDGLWNRSLPEPRSDD